MVFYGSNDPTNSVKALKQVVVLGIGFNPTRSTSPCYNTTHACNVHKIIIHENESMHSEMGPVRQNPIQLNSNVSPTCPHNMVNLGLLAAEIFWRVKCIPANFNGFRDLQCYCTAL